MNEKKNFLSGIVDPKDIARSTTFRARQNILLIAIQTKPKSAVKCQNGTMSCPLKEECNLATYDQLVTEATTLMNKMFRPEDNMKNKHLEKFL